MKDFSYYEYLCWLPVLQKTLYRIFLYTVGGNWLGAFSLLQTTLWHSWNFLGISLKQI